MSAKPAPKLPLADEFNQIMASVFCPHSVRPAPKFRKCRTQDCTHEALAFDYCADCERDRGPFEFSPEDYE